MTGRGRPQRELVPDVSASEHQLAEAVREMIRGRSLEQIKAQTGLTPTVVSQASSGMQMASERTLRTLATLSGRGEDELKDLLQLRVEVLAARAALRRDPRDPEPTIRPLPTPGCSRVEFLATWRAARGSEMSLRRIADTVPIGKSTIGRYFAPANTQLPPLKLMLFILRGLGYSEVELEDWQKAWVRLTTVTDPAVAAALQEASEAA